MSSAPLHFKLLARIGLTSSARVGIDVSAVLGQESVYYVCRNFVKNYTIQWVMYAGDWPYHCLNIDIPLVSCTIVYITAGMKLTIRDRRQFSILDQHYFSQLLLS